MELKLISLLGWLTMIAAAWVISYNRKNFPWRTVIWGIGLQFLLALLILKTPWGGALFEFAGKVVQKLIQFSTEGTKFVFGPLADADLLGKTFGPEHSLVFAILVIRPYIPRMTRSELMTIMVCGMAHIAGGVAAVYAAMGMAAGYQNTAGHLLTASVLNCPAALLIAKIMLPETQVSETAGTSPATV